MIYDTIVVGAGVGGISSALLRSLQEKKILLIEAHSLLGGCSSYFERGPFNFDVGATTLSGVKSNQPLGELFQKLSLNVPLKKIDPGIVFHLSSGKILSRYSDPELWLKELEKISSRDEKFWKHISSKESQGWDLLKVFRPFTGVNAATALKALSPKVLSLLPLLAINGEQDLKRFQTPNAELTELLNGVSLISAQALLPEIPALISSMSLNYPAETYYPWGGMKGLNLLLENEMKKREIQIEKKTKVEKIISHPDYMEVKTAKNTYHCKKVICNLTHWALQNILEEKSSNEMMSAVKKRPMGPAAFTMYFAFKPETLEHNLYHQIHLNQHLVKNYFSSFSHPDDRARAPEGWQTVTLSTHTDPLLWENLSEDEYEELKMKHQEIIWNDFTNRFPLSEFKYLSSGTPLTFEHYTHRPKGMVGGLPFLWGQGPWDFLTGNFQEKRLFRVGDTVFPGQGWVGVVAGALNLDEIINRQYH